VALLKTGILPPAGCGVNMFGQAAASDDGAVTLICGEPPHVCGGSAPYVSAGYAVFVNEPDPGKYADYTFRWDLSYDLGDKAVHDDGFITGGDTLGVALPEAGCRSVSVQLEVTNGSATWNLNMRGNVRPLEQHMEALYGNYDKLAAGALAGEISISREMSNNLWQEVLFAVSADNVLDADVGRIPTRFLGAVLYMLLHHYQAGRGPDADGPDAAGALLNADGAQDFNTYKLGMARISKEMAVQCAERGGGSFDFTDIDFYNLARFQRSHVCLLASMLSGLKRGSAYESLTAEALYADQDAMTALAKAFFEIHGFGAAADAWARRAAKTSAFPFIYIQPDMVYGFETIRVAVLDVRSGQPVRNARVRRIRLADDDGNTLDDTYFSPESEPVEKLANPPDPARPYGIEASQRALARFRTKVHTAAGDTWPEKFGLSETQARGDYTAPAARNAYNRYWDERNCSFLNIGPLQPSPPADHYCMIAQEYNAHRATDADGMLDIMIPKIRLLTLRKFNIEVGFHDFPVSLGKLAGPWARANALDTASVASAGATGFRSSWDGTQDMDWGGNTGWLFQSAGEPRLLGWMMVSESLQIEMNADKYGAVKFNADRFSAHFNADRVGFVLYAMQWCQPVWDGGDIDEPLTGKRFNNSVFVNQRYPGGDWVRDIGMHIVTMSYGSANVNPFGHYYGFYSNIRDMNNRNHRPSVPATAATAASYGNHPGIDIYSGRSTHLPCFACHGGWMTPQYTSVGFGNYETLFILHDHVPGSSDPKHADGPYFLYGHLSDRKPKGRALCGQIVGACGDDGYHNSPSYSRHLHFELRPRYNFGERGNGVEPTHIADVLSPYPQITCDPENVKVMPGNRLPLVLPCACTYGSSGYASGCNLTGGFFAKCWAVQEFPYTDEVMIASCNNLTADMPEFVGTTEFICPKILDPGMAALGGSADAQLQAKLKWLCANGGGDIADTNAANGIEINGNARNSDSTKLVIGNFISKYCNAAATPAQVSAFIEYFTGRAAAANVDASVRGWVDELNRQAPWRTRTF